MKFIKVQNHVYNLSCIFDIFYTMREEKNFNRINYQYYIRTTGGILLEISQFEFNELEKFLFRIKYENTEA